jgi:hypothetical protein
VHHNGFGESNHLGLRTVLNVVVRTVPTGGWGIHCPCVWNEPTVVPTVSVGNGTYRRAVTLHTVVGYNQLGFGAEPTKLGVRNPPTWGVIILPTGWGNLRAVDLKLPTAFVAMCPTGRRFCQNGGWLCRECGGTDCNHRVTSVCDYRWLWTVPTGFWGFQEPCVADGNYCGWIY